MAYKHKIKKKKREKNCFHVSRCEIFTDRRRGKLLTSVCVCVNCEVEGGFNKSQDIDKRKREKGISSFRRWYFLRPQLRAMRKYVFPILIEYRDLKLTFSSYSFQNLKLLRIDVNVNVNGMQNKRIQRHMQSNESSYFPPLATPSNFKCGS